MAQRKLNRVISDVQRFLVVTVLLMLVTPAQAFWFTSLRHSNPFTASQIEIPNTGWSLEVGDGGATATLTGENVPAQALGVVLGVDDGCGVEFCAPVPFELDVSIVFGNGEFNQDTGQFEYFSAAGTETYVGDVTRTLDGDNIPTGTTWNIFTCRDIGGVCDLPVFILEEIPVVQLLAAPGQGADQGTENGVQPAQLEAEIALNFEGLNGFNGCTPIYPLDPAFPCFNWLQSFLEVVPYPDELPGDSLLDRDQFAVSVPEPGTLGLFAFGLAGLGWARRRAGFSRSGHGSITRIH